MDHIKKYLNEIKSLVAADKLSSAIKYLDALLTNTSNTKEAALLLSRYNRILKESRKGTISSESVDVSKNQLSEAILDLIKEIENQYDENHEIRNELNRIREEDLAPIAFDDDDDEHLIRKTPNTLQRNLVLAVIFILVPVIIYYLSDLKNSEDGSSVKIIDTSIEGGTDRIGTSSPLSLGFYSEVEEDSLTDNNQESGPIAAKQYGKSASSENVKLNVAPSASKRDFPELTFTLRNEGEMEAYFNEFEIELDQFELNTDPVLELESYHCSNDKEPQILFNIQNNGWGQANNLQVKDLGYFNTYVDLATKQYPEIAGGEKMTVFELPIIKTFKMKRDTFSVHFTYTDSKGKSHQYQDDLPLEERCCGCTQVALDPDVVYISLFDFPEAANYSQKKSYRISRVIPAKGLDQFAVKLGVKKSCSVRATFTFKVEGEVVSSQSQKLIIWNPRNSGLNELYRDGQTVLRDTRPRSGSLGSNDN